VEPREFDLRLGLGHRLDFHRLRAAPVHESCPPDHPRCDRDAARRGPDDATTGPARDPIAAAPPTIVALREARPGPLDAEGIGAEDGAPPGGVSGRALRIVKVPCELRGLGSGLTTRIGPPCGCRFRPR
jgi:hypothetical protein